MATPERPSATPNICPECGLDWVVIAAKDARSLQLMEALEWAVKVISALNETSSVKRDRNLHELFDRALKKATTALSGDDAEKWRKVFEVAAKYGSPHPGLPPETHKADITYAVGKAFIAALHSGEPNVVPTRPAGVS